MFKKAPLGAVLIFMILLVGIVSADYNITYTSGETYIRWDWDFNSPTTITDIYVDGINVTPDIIGTHYYLQDLNPSEKHLISLYNGSTLVETAQGKTALSSLMVYFSLILLVGITLLTLVAKLPYQQLLFGTIGCIVGIALYLELNYSYSIFSNISLLLTLVNGIILCLVMVDLYEQT